MNRAYFYAGGLPAEFSPPDQAAARIVALPTRAEREAYWLRIPEPWRPLIGHLVQLHLGMTISELPDVESRRKALEEVPGIWLEEVRWHVRRLFNTREIRAQYRAERAADRDLAIQNGKW